jgi:CheY-like chemotaxis protein
MDGFQVAAALRRDPRWVTTPIIMLSSTGQGLGARRDGALRLAAYLTKPVGPSDLWNALAGALHTSKLDGEPISPMSRPSPESRQGLRILLAEDNAVNQRLATRLLEKAGHEVTVVESGRQAIEALEREPFALVFMDVQMPEMDGFAATALIREREAATGRHVPIVAMTAHALKGDEERCLAAGMDAYVPKPVKAAELVAAIDRVLSAARSGSFGAAPPPGDATR